MGVTSKKNVQPRLPRIQFMGLFQKLHFKHAIRSTLNDGF
jgi:hypothetical protein